MRLGEVIHFWRKAHKFSLRDAAEIIGISHSALARLENGEEIDLTNFLKIQAWLLSK